VTGKAKITPSPVSIKWPAMFSSYNTNKNVIYDGSAKAIVKNVEARHSQKIKLNKEIENMKTHQMFGKKNSKNLIIGWGGTKGAIIDSIHDLDCEFMQIIYLEPFSKKIAQIIKKSKNIIIVEGNETSQLSSLIMEKTGISVDHKILKFDGRPFHADELRKEIQRRLK
jgi:2-oxoglutarate ferredoxin oxidoreductase subunit alpha